MNGETAKRPLYVLWWQPLHLRWWDEEEVLQANSEGKFRNGEEDYKAVAEFHALRQRVGRGNIRRDSSTGCVEVQARSIFGDRGGPLGIVCTTDAPTASMRSGSKTSRCYPV